MNSELISDELTLAEFCVPPSDGLSLAEAIVAHAGLVIRDVLESDREVSAEEADRLHRRVQELQETLTETETYIDDIGSVETDATECVNKTSENGGESYYCN